MSDISAVTRWSKLSGKDAALTASGAFGVEKMKEFIDSWKDLMVLAELGAEIGARVKK